MIIKKGKIEDVKEIMHIIKDAIIDMELQDIFQWDNIYPNEDVISNDIYEAIRLDSFINNYNACRLYAKNCYEQRGIVKFRKGEFWCLEKKLETDEQQKVFL